MLVTLQAAQEVRERAVDVAGALALHIKQAHEDVDKVNISAGKITKHFKKIERVELENDEAITVSSLPVDEDK